ncbi:hypothetical protein KSP40_PGU018002 [Platanthera guangdongensis]|uniref:Uncharacterized protein n=1 Tax=Platanthera guangdongensis TaxID=2320717 RepID=A0ABR2MMA4_9ASPA
MPILLFRQRFAAPDESDLFSSPCPTGHLGSPWPFRSPCLSFSSARGLPLHTRAIFSPVCAQPAARALLGHFDRHAYPSLPPVVCRSRRERSFLQSVPLVRHCKERWEFTILFLPFNLLVPVFFRWRGQNERQPCDEERRSGQGLTPCPTETTLPVFRHCCAPSQLKSVFSRHHRRIDLHLVHRRSLHHFCPVHQFFALTIAYDELFNYAVEEVSTLLSGGDSSAIRALTKSTLLLCKAIRGRSSSSFTRSVPLQENVLSTKLVRTVEKREEAFTKNLCKAQVSSREKPVARLMILILTSAVDPAGSNTIDLSEGSGGTHRSRSRMQQRGRSRSPRGGALHRIRRRQQRGQRRPNPTGSGASRGGGVRRFSNRHLQI